MGSGRRYIDAAVNGALQPSYRYTRLDNGQSSHYGKILEIDPPRRLVQTFEHDYSVDRGAGPDDPSRVTWEIAQLGDLCKLTLIHDGWKADSKSF